MEASKKLDFSYRETGHKLSPDENESLYEDLSQVLTDILRRQVRKLQEMGHFPRINESLAGWNPQLLPLRDSKWQERLALGPGGRLFIVEKKQDCATGQTYYHNVRHATNVEVVLNYPSVSCEIEALIESKG
jgi:hypothetical protein